MKTSSSDAGTRRTLSTAMPAACSANVEPPRIAQRRVRGDPDVRTLAEQLHIGDPGQPLEHARRAIPVRRDDFHDDSWQGRAQIGGSVERDEPAFVEQRHTRAALGLVEIRRRHQNRDSLREKFGEQLPELAPRHGIDAGRRLVEQNDSRLVHQRACERQLLFHPARQLLGETCAELRQLRQLEQAVPAIANGRVAHAEAVNLGEERDVFVDGEIAVQAEPLRQIPERLGHLEVLLHRIAAEHAHAFRHPASATRTSGESRSSCPRRPAR